MNQFRERPSNIIHVRQSPRKDGSSKAQSTTPRGSPSKTPTQRLSPIRETAPPSSSENTLSGKENIFPRQVDINNTQRCWDWIVVQGSTHFARDRASFATYKAFQDPTTTTIFNSLPRPVIGIGTVKIEVSTGPAENAPTRTITLKNVLHMPTALYNGFCAKRQGDLQSFDHPIQAWDKFGRPTWCTKDFWGWQRVVIAGHNEGISPIRETALRLGKEEGCLFAS